MSYRETYRGLCNVDQSCRSLSSIIVFSDFPRFKTWAARSEIQAQWIARNHDGDAWESVFIMATNLSACHPGDGIEALNRLPGLAEPLLEIDLERELQQWRSLVAAGNWSVASTQYSGSPSHRAMVEALSS